MSDATDKKTRISKVILVGHCGADTGSLTWFVGDATGLPVEGVNSAARLRKVMAPDTLLLVNRVLDGDFDADTGVALIGELAKETNPPPMMLVSNYTDAQAAAEKAGALPGFGKSQIGEKKLADRLRAMA